MGQAVWTSTSLRGIVDIQSAAQGVVGGCVCGGGGSEFQLLSWLGYTCSVGRQGNFR